MAAVDESHLPAHLRGQKEAAERIERARLLHLIQGAWIGHLAATVGPADVFARRAVADAAAIAEALGAAQAQADAIAEALRGVRSLLERQVADGEALQFSPGTSQ